jgi:RNA polymerase sigma-70 factor (ECF subfamily)
MLGTVADAEDMLQEAFIRWQLASNEEVRSAKAFLVTVITRLCVNHLQSARVRREQYVGQWLPEPIVTDPQSDPLGVIRADESLDGAARPLRTLDRGRAGGFLLHEVFRFKYAEIAAMLGQSEANCRQVLRRARQHVGAVRQRFKTNSREHRKLFGRFLEAARNGDMEGLIALLSTDVALHVDGGGRGVVPNVIHGADKVVRGLLGGVRRLPDNLVIRKSMVNGQPGAISYLDGKPYSVLVLDVADGRVRTVYIVSNPQKLSHLPDLTEAP